MLSTALTMMAPPRTRGWTGGKREQGIDGSGSPAHAGMDRFKSLAPCTFRGLPRARGDGPMGEYRSFFHRLAPPRTRGWTVIGAFSKGLHSGSPAHAGMDPLEILPIE